MVIEMEEDKLIKRFIIILLVVLGTVIIAYLITSKFVKKDSTTAKENTPVEISYDNALVGNMLHKVDAKYYVMIFDSTSENAASYAQIATSYKTLDNHLPLYIVDLNDALNKKYKTDGETSLNGTIDEFKFGEITLLKVEDGTIKTFSLTEKNIKSELGIK